jgi:hypothetical protein
MIRDESFSDKYAHGSVAHTYKVVALLVDLYSIASANWNFRASDADLQLEAHLLTSPVPLCYSSRNNVISNSRDFPAKRHNASSHSISQCKSFSGPPNNQR